MAKASLHFDLPDSGATEILGAALACAFPGSDVDTRAGAGTGAGADTRAGAVVHLRGELGSGKTTCARSLLHALGVTGTVRSPTYTLVDTYSISDSHGPTLNCVHVDLYRVQSSAEVEELGLRDLTGPGYLMLIEWPEKGGSAVPPADLDLVLQYAGEAREGSARAASDVGRRWLEKLSLDSSLTPYVSNLT
jgi:tRNA threonylcarbamoyladenosine biosynthesis protein TsaE